MRFIQVISLVSSMSYAHVTGTDLAKIDGARISKALTEFHQDCGYYPSTEDGLALLQKKDERCPNWGSYSYLSPIPLDPWGRSWIYTSNGSSFLLKTLGADGKKGGLGENMDIETSN